MFSALEYRHEHPKTTAEGPGHAFATGIRARIAQHRRCTCSSIGCHGWEETLNGQMGGVVACGVAARQHALPVQVLLV